MGNYFKHLNFVIITFDPSNDTQKKRPKLDLFGAFLF